MAATPEPLTPAEIGERAERLARAARLPSQADDVFEHGHEQPPKLDAEQARTRFRTATRGDGRWQLNQTARRRIESAPGQ